MSQPTMFNSGLQSERTALAWRRTSLSLLVGSVVAGRVLAPILDGWAVAIGAVGLIVTTIVWVASGRRDRVATAALSGTTVLPGSGLLCFLALAVALAAAIGLLYVVAAALS